jgi:hypothetical protein
VSRLQRNMARIGIALLSVAATLAMLSITFPAMLGALPLDARRFVPPPYDRLADDTKEGLVPRDYIAIVGDSYAFGLGDWVLEALGSEGWWPRKPFDSAYVLHQQLGNDVISFGSAGFGSIDGIAIAPIVSLELLNRRFGVDIPRLFLVYFYEGNDLSDNLKELRAGGYDATLESVSDRGRFSAWLYRRIASAIRDGDSGRFLALKFFEELCRNAWRRVRGRAREMPAMQAPLPSHRYNRAKTVSGFVDLPDRLDGPELELSDQETAVAIEAFRASLEFLERSIPHSRVVVVYLPAVLSCYALEGEVSVHTVWSRPEVYPASAVRPRSERIAGAIRDAVLASDAGFIDPRAALDADAARAAIHGPRDWRHFNRRGYETLGTVIATRLRAAEWPALTRFDTLRRRESAN